MILYRVAGLKAELNALAAALSQAIDAAADPQPPTNLGTAIYNWGSQ